MEQREQSDACINYAKPMEQRVECQVYLNNPESRQRKTKVNVTKVMEQSYITPQHLNLNYAKTDQKP